jgi:hypothetical protein
MQVTKEQFFAYIGPLDVVVSCDYTRGADLVSNFKTRGGRLVGRISGQLFGMTKVYDLFQD